ncbi:tyrosine-type recombinase/integrase [Coprococcus comes]|uniref:tyrosine-type recombinase/integrase n=1 Tax=Coprococcus comes TaxID=410072 RepID=UPI0018A02FD3|nr:Arm DNA-binding domain-containing protein [Coprococcus comes]MDC0797610.1 Arm DNA-binding domain-containing protein [Coprococcus comes]
MPQYKYPVKNGIKWMAKFNYTDSKSGKAKTEYKRGFASKREAKKYEEDFIENLIMPEETEIEPIRTFGEVFQEYLMSHKRADIKESTLETKFNIFNKHIFPTFEEKQVDTITDDDIANWQNEIKSVVQPNGKHFSESYLRTIQSQFNSIINYALNKGYMKSNPLVDIKNMGIKDKRVEFWTPEEYEKFAYYAMEYSQYYYAYEVLYWCGLRIGELLALSLINYGYIEGVMAPDGEEQDAYILGVNEPVKKFTGKIIAIVRRKDGIEEKWVVVPDGVTFSKEEIRRQIHFQEQYFDSEIVM